MAKSIGHSPVCIYIHPKLAASWPAPQKPRKTEVGVDQIKDPKIELVKLTTVHQQEKRIAVEMSG